MPSCTAWAKLQGRAIHPHISSKGSSGAGGGNNENRLACSNNELFEQALLANLSHTSLHPGKQFSKYRTTSVRFLLLNADRFE